MATNFVLMYLFMNFPPFNRYTLQHKIAKICMNLKSTLTFYQLYNDNKQRVLVLQLAKLCCISRRQSSKLDNAWNVMLKCILADVLMMFPWECFASVSCIYCILKVYSLIIYKIYFTTDIYFTFSGNNLTYLIGLFNFK